MFDRATMELNVEPLILGALREDITSEDVSTNCIMRDKCPGNVELICKQDGVICGLQVFERVFTLLDPETEVVTYVKDGDKVEKGQKWRPIPVRLRTCWREPAFACWIRGRPHRTIGFLRSMRCESAADATIGTTFPMA